MSSFPIGPINRRRFFTGAARLAALFALAALAAGQEFKRRRLADDPNCIKLFSCLDCAEFKRCSKPKAEESKHSRAARAGRFGPRA